MRGALGTFPGVAKIDIEVGDPDFVVHYDSAKTSPQKLVEKLKTAEPEAKVKS